MSLRVHDARPCELGEGPLWDDVRGELLWFDILNDRMLSRDGDEELTWQFEERISAAARIDDGRLLIAAETALFAFDPATGTREEIVPLEPEITENRPNDGRGDPHGGFWIGTMGKVAKAGTGTIYRYYKGELRALYPGLTVPNAICFDPNGDHAYFGDTVTHKIMRVALDAAGWPKGDPEVFVDGTGHGLLPDGAIVDADGTLWNAQWGGFRVAAYGPDGKFQRSIAFPAEQTSCPALGGADGMTLFVTTARQRLSEADMLGLPLTGQTFAVPGVAPAPPPTRVLLG